MKKYVFYLVALLPVVVFAQNWSPIRVNEKMNYQHTDSDYISHTLWVDSIDVTGSDTTFFLNKIVIDHPTDPDKVLKNQPQFLYKSMTNIGGGIYHFADPGFYILQSWAGLNDTWIFDLDSNITAEVAQIIEIEIFGEMDSVKFISLSNGDEIQLSKSFGIIRFPIFENEGNYDLIGIQGTEYGESVPGFWEMFNFEAGDVFQYHYYHWNLQSGSSFQEHYTLKYEITSKTIDSAGYYYDREGYKSGYWNGGNGNNYYSFPVANQGNYIEANIHSVVKYYQNQLYFLEGMDCWVNGDQGEMYTRAKIGPDPLGLIYKHYGMQLSQFNGHEVFYPINEGNDTMYVLNNMIENCFTDIPFGETYKEGLGLTMRYKAGSEEETEWHMEGYVKNGDTVGVITPDSILYTGNSIVNQLEDLKVFPNPARDRVTILNLPTEISRETILQLFSLDGKLVKFIILNNPSNSFSIIDLQVGLYIYSITQDQKIIKRGKLIVQ